MKYTTLLLSGVPQKVQLVDLSYCLNRLFYADDEIGSFALRDLPSDGRKRRIALDFRSGFDAIAAQARLDSYHYKLPDGGEYTLCAKITWKEEFMRQQTSSPEPWREEGPEMGAEEPWPGMALVPAVSEGAMYQANANLDAQLELLKKQKLILRTERKLLKQKRKLKKEYASLYDNDSEDQPKTSKRRRKSKSHRPATPDPQDLQISSSGPKNPMPKLKALMSVEESKSPNLKRKTSRQRESRSRSKDRSPESCDKDVNGRRAKWDAFDIHPMDRISMSKNIRDYRLKSPERSPQVRKSSNRDRNHTCSGPQISGSSKSRLRSNVKELERESRSTRSRSRERLAGYRSRSRERLGSYRSRSREKLASYRSRSRESLASYRSRSWERPAIYRSRSRERLASYRSRSRERLASYRSRSRERPASYRSRSRESLASYRSRSRERPAIYRSPSRERLASYRSRSRERLASYRSRSRERPAIYKSRSRERLASYRSRSRERLPSYRTRSRERDPTREKKRPLAIMPQSPEIIRSPRTRRVSLTTTSQSKEATMTKYNLDANITIFVDVIPKKQVNGDKNKTDDDSNHGKITKPSRSSVAVSEFTNTKAGFEAPVKNKKNKIKKEISAIEEKATSSIELSAIKDEATSSKELDKIEEKTSNKETSAIKVEATTCKELSAIKEKATSNKELSAIKDKATSSKELSAIKDKATSSKELSAIKEIATSSKELSAIKKKATTSKKLSARTEKATSSKEFSSIKVKTTSSNELSAIKEKATSSKKLTAIKEKATSSKELSAIKKKATTSKEVIAIKEKATTSKKLSAMTEKATSSKELSVIKEKATSSKEFSAIKVKATSSNELSAIKEKATSSKELSAVKEKATSSKGLSAIKEKATSSKELSAIKKKATSSKELSEIKEKAITSKELIVIKQKATTSKEIIATKEKATTSKELSAIKEKATSRKEIIATKEKATTSKELSAIKEKATSGKELSAVKKKASSSKELSAIKEKATTSKELIVIKEKATTSKELSAMTEKATSSKELSAIKEKATSSKEIIATKEKATTSKELSAIKEKATSGKELSAVKEVALSTIKEKATTSNKLSAIKEKATSSKKLSAINEKATSSEELSAIKEKATKSKDLSAIKEKATPINILASKFTSTISGSKAPNKNKIHKDSANKEKATESNVLDSEYSHTKVGSETLDNSIERMGNIGNDIMRLMHSILEEISLKEKRQLSVNQKALIDGILSARILNRIKPLMDVKNITEEQVILNYRELYSKEIDTKLISELLDGIRKETCEKDLSAEAMDNVEKNTISEAPDKWSDPGSSIIGWFTKFMENQHDDQFHHKNETKKCTEKKTVSEKINKQNMNHLTIIEVIDLDNEDSQIKIDVEKTASNNLTITEEIEIKDTEADNKDIIIIDETKPLKGKSKRVSKTAFIDITFDKDFCPIPARPQFVLVLKKLLKQMKISIKKADKKGLREFPMSMFKCALRTMLRNLVAGKGYLGTSEIVKLFRAKYPKEEDCVLINQVIEDIKMGKYGKYTEAGQLKDTDDDKDDVILIDSKCDVIIVLDSDDDVDQIKSDQISEKPNLDDVKPIKRELQNIQNVEATPTLQSQDQCNIVKTEPNDYVTTVVKETSQINEVITSNDKIPEAQVTGSNVSAANLPINGIDREKANQTNSSGFVNRTNEPVDNIKQEIESEFTDAAVENLLDSLKSFDTLDYVNDTEKETPQVTAITIMTSFSELISLRNEIIQSSDKVGNVSTDKEASEIKIENDLISNTMIKTECVPDDQQYGHESAPDEGNCSNDSNKVIQDREVGKPNNESGPTVEDGYVACTTKAKIISREDDEESIESITKYLDYLRK